MLKVRYLLCNLRASGGAKVLVKSLQGIRTQPDDTLPGIDTHELASYEEWFRVVTELQKPNLFGGTIRFFGLIQLITPDGKVLPNWPNELLTRDSIADAIQAALTEHDTAQATEITDLKARMQELEHETAVIPALREQLAQAEGKLKTVVVQSATPPLSNAEPKPNETPAAVSTGASSTTEAPASAPTAPASVPVPPGPPITETVTTTPEQDDLKAAGELIRAEFGKRPDPSKAITLKVLTETTGLNSAEIKAAIAAPDSGLVLKGIQHVALAAKPQA